jgi:hypothetical protein|nr:MAG TPA: hypothetical protein [Caudoviricetes sp.]
MNTIYIVEAAKSKIRIIYEKYIFDDFEDGYIRLEMAKNSHKNICVNLKKHIKLLSPSPPKRLEPLKFQRFILYIHELYTNFI